MVTFVNRRFLADAVIFVSITLFLLVAIESLQAASLRLVALDVGEGQSVLVVDQGHGLLIDTGQAGKTSHVLSRLKAYDVTQLDYLILSHLHPDHAGGYFRVREAFPGTPVLDSCHSINPRLFADQDMVRWVNDALETDSHRRCVKGGQTFSWQGHLVQFLWPYKPAGENLNHHSLVVQIVTSNGKKILVMGDVDTSVELELLKTMKEEWQEHGVDVLIAGHHGARDSSDEDFVALIKPHYTLVSVNENNLQGYPSDKTMQILKTHSQFLFRTDQAGEICLELSERPVPCKKSLL